MWRDWARRRTREPAGDELQDTLLRREEAPANDEEAQEVGERADSHEPASTSGSDDEAQEPPAAPGGDESSAEQPGAAGTPLQPPRREVDRLHLGRHIIRAVVSSQSWLFFIILFRCCQASAAVAVLLDVASLSSASSPGSPPQPEQCDNGHLLRAWLGVYAGRCVALSLTLFRGFRLSRAEAIDDFDGTFAHEELNLRRIQVERTKLWLNSFGTLWTVLGALWLFGSADCASAAPVLSGTVLAFVMLAAAGMALPLILFSLLCCFLPMAMVGLSTFGEQLGIVPEAGGEAGDDFRWIDLLPTHPFSTAHPMARIRAAANPAAAGGAGAGASGGDGASTSAAAAAADEEAGGIAAAGAEKEAGEGAPPAVPAGGGWVGKLRLEEEDASCCICIGEYTDGAAVRVLPRCNHHFHQSCIDTWLRVNASCPLCKALVGPAAEAADAAAAAAEEEAADEEAPRQQLLLRGAPARHGRHQRSRRQGGRRASGGSSSSASGRQGDRG